MTRDSLKAIIAAHEEWVKSDFTKGARADLSEKDLREFAGLLRAANLRDANLSDANLSGANLRGANLSDANLSGAYLSELLAVPELDKKILAAIEAGGVLDMSVWHGDTACGTTHCRAGWAIHLAGEKGQLLEAIYGSAAAGALIYAASRPDKPIPDFWAPTKVALESIKADAAA